MCKILSIMFFCSFFKLFSQEYSKELFLSEGDTLPYRILLPKEFDPNIEYPLVLFLHGAGERGNDNELQLVHGSSLFLQNDIRETFPSIVLFPQCPKNSSWASILENKNRSFKFSPNPIENNTLKLVEGLLEDVKKKYNVISSQIYVGGLSMGGMGTFELVYRNPNLFAAAFAICGGANPEIAEKISSTQWKIFHGDSDMVVPLDLSIKMYESIKKFNSSVSLTVYPGINHNSWENVFKEPDLIPWLFSIVKN